MKRKDPLIYLYWTKSTYLKINNGKWQSKDLRGLSNIIVSISKLKQQVKQQRKLIRSWKFFFKKHK